MRKIERLEEMYADIVPLRDPRYQGVDPCLRRGFYYGAQQRTTVSLSHAVPVDIDRHLSGGCVRLLR